jgi:molybdopterin/thiamine biosynthesis adenylyltransferase
MSWGKKNPGELEIELNELNAAGFNPQLVENEEGTGPTTVNIQLDVLGTARQGKIQYPNLFPWFKPTLIVEGIEEELRHYNPNSGEICLLQRGTRYWNPGTTAAAYVTEQLAKWEKVATRKHDEPRLDIEDQQAEPISAYFQRPNQRVMIDSSWTVPDELTSGFLDVAFTKQGNAIKFDEPLILWALSVKDHNKKTIITLDEKLLAHVSRVKDRRKSIPWFRIDAPLVDKDLREALNRTCPQALKLIENELKNRQRGICALLFKEESPQGGVRDGWLYIAYYCESAVPTKQGKKRGKGKPRAAPSITPRVWLFGSEPAGESDFRERIPELSPLKNKVVAFIGLGCVGAPSALQFAKAGVGELRLVDGDFISPGTTCRWPLGYPVAGWGKVDTLGNFIQQHYPFTRIGRDHYPPNSDGRMNIGSLDSDYDQRECLETLLKGADLVYDATAEEGINHLLSWLAKEKGIPYVCVSSRPGGWGGDVVRITPKTKGCYVCFLHAQRQEEEEGKINEPPYDPAGEALQPNGCGDVTFTAASMDVEEISLAGVRMAISTLCSGEDGTYPEIEYDVGILTLRENNRLMFPKWEHFPLPKHPLCNNC